MRHAIRGVVTRVKYATTPRNCWTRYPPRYSNGWAEFWSEPMKPLVNKLNHAHWLRMVSHCLHAQKVLPNQGNKQKLTQYHHNSSSKDIKILLVESPPCIQEMHLANYHREVTSSQPSYENPQQAQHAAGHGRQQWVPYLVSCRELAYFDDIQATTNFC